MNRVATKKQSGRHRAIAALPRFVAVAGFVASIYAGAAHDALAQIPPKPKSLVTNVFSGTFDRCFRESLVPVFTRNTGIELTLITTQPPVAKLQAEGDSPEIDIFIAGETDIKAAYEFGVLSKLDEALLPNLKDNYKSLQTDGKLGDVRYGVAFTTSAQGLVYDASKWPTPPTSWFDLASDATPGVVNVRVPDNQNTVGWMAVMANSLNGRWPTQVGDYAGVLDLMKAKLAPRLGALLPSAGAMQASFVNDPRSSLTVGTDSVAAAMGDRAPNIKWVAPKESAYHILTMAAVTNTKQKYWAQAMLNHLLDPEVQAKFAECGYYTPSNKNTAISPKIAGKVMHGEAEIEKLSRISWDTIKPIAPELGRLFMQAVQSK